MYDISSLVEYYYRARGPGHERNPVGVTTLKAKDNVRCADTGAKMRGVVNRGPRKRTISDDVHSSGPSQAVTVEVLNVPAAKAN